MPAYVIGFVDVHDAARFGKEYVPPTVASIVPYGGRVLAATDEVETMEGTVPAGRAVIIEFPDVERARNWYASDAYVPLIRLRKSLATTSLVIIPGV
jgi:uncharacterized protein (DUF1330 family)